MGHVLRRIFEQGIQLKADVAVVALRGFMNRAENLLRLPHQQVGQLPGDLLIPQTPRHQRRQFLIKAAGLDNVGDDDGVGSSAGGAALTIDAQEIRINGIEPESGSAFD